MRPYPAWLPDLLSLTGNRQGVITALYEVFRRDFVIAQPTFQGQRIGWDRQTRVDGVHDDGFWHLVTRENTRTGERQIDDRRAERLPWCAPTLTHADDPEVRVWDYREGHGRLRTYMWLEVFDYVVVLESRNTRAGPVMVLVTAYHVDGERTRNQLGRKYAKRRP